MVCRNRTVQGINDSFVGHLDQSALNNFLTDFPWSEEKLTKTRYKFVVSKLEELKLGDGLLILDDTISRHVGKRVEGAGWHHDVKEGKAVWGYQLVTSHYVR